MWGHSEKASVSEPRKEDSEETNTLNTFIWDF